MDGTEPASPESAELAWRLVKVLHPDVAARVNALLVLRDILMRGQELTVPDVTELLGVTTRTAQRYVNDLFRAEPRVSVALRGRAHVYRWGAPRTPSTED